MIERFNGRICDVLATTRFDSSQTQSETIIRYLRISNQYTPQKAPGHISPVKSMRKWYEIQAESFKKRVYNLTGLNKIWVGMECRYEYVTALSLDMSVSFFRKCRDFRAVAPEHGWLHGFKRLGAGRRSHHARSPDGQAPTTVQKPANTPKSTILATGALAMASRISMHQ